ncbi:MAG TPA: GNAT family N-acetyltransferase [Herpetosiphonaceae bacterium]
MSDELIIREARPEDRAAVLEATLAAYEQYAERMPHWESYQRHLRSLLGGDVAPGVCIVAELGGAIAGSVLLYPASARVYAVESANGPWPELRLLAVAPAARGRGVGAALLEECVRRARADGEAYLGLHTEDMMAVAQQMYQRRGFARVPEKDFEPAPGVHVKGYRLPLDENAA